MPKKVPCGCDAQRKRPAGYAAGFAAGRLEERAARWMEDPRIQVGILLAKAKTSAKKMIDALYHVARNHGLYAEKDTRETTLLARSSQGSVLMQPAFQPGYVHIAVGGPKQDPARIAQDAGRDLAFAEAVATLQHMREFSRDTIMGAQAPAHVGWAAGVKPCAKLGASRGKKPLNAKRRAKARREEERPSEMVKAALLRSGGGPMRDRRDRRTKDARRLRWDDE